MKNKHVYYMPLGAQDFRGWARNFVAVAQANKALFGFTDAELAPLGTGVDTLDAAVAKADGETATKEDIRHKNTVLNATRHQFQAFVNSRVNYNDNIDNDGRANLRTHIRDTTRTTIPVPADLVRLRITPLDGHGHRIDFVSAATGKKAIPYGMNGVVLAGKILEDGEPVPERGEDLPDTVLITSSPHATDYPPNLAGKRVAYSAAWQNEKGEKGKFSDVEARVIP
ncbi:MAG: hypothetical protein LBK63_02780 [Treponema sp.]|jgi:hypothetical protein|nr:hypothetical protein [Treponema sp.]